MEVEMTLDEKKKEKVETTVKRTKGVGLDVGTMFFVGAVKIKDQIECKTIRDAFYQMPKKDLMLQMLKKQGVPFLDDGDNLYIVGDHSIDFASMHNKEIDRPLSKGVINKKIKDKAGLIISEMLKVAVGHSQYQNEICYYSVPAEPIDASYNIGFHEDIFGMYLKSLGYEARPLNEAEAIGYAELGSQEDSMTGMCLSFGAGMTNCALLLFGDAAIKFSVARGGDWIDENAAEYADSTRTDIISIKEDAKKQMSIKEPSSYEQQAIASYYHRHIKYVLTNFNQHLNTNQVPRFPKPINIVYSGGTTMISGFDEIFRKEMDDLEWPFEIKEVRQAKEPMTATARGCLIASLALGEG